MIGNLLAKFQHKGFVGPHYRGLPGKLRFLLESTVARHELVFVATPESFAAVTPPEGPPLELHPVREFADFAPYRQALEAEYYPGYLEAWAAPFTWGEQAVVGTVEGRVACYNWMQFGTPEGFPTYYGRMFEHEARILRGGVAPSHRRGGINTLMKYRLLREFFDSGVTRVYAECYQHNLPSVRTLLRLGFRPVGVLSVLEIPMAKGFVRWAPVTSVVEEFRRLGVELVVAHPQPASRLYHVPNEAAVV